MSGIILQPTVISHWYVLINEAEHRLCLQLDESQESYLVFLLLRFMQKAEWLDSVLAFDFFNVLQTKGKQRQHQLQELGDKCLLFAGFFPEQAKRKRVDENYFINMGRHAYAELVPIGQHFSLLCEGFQAMIDVLKATRNLQNFTLNVGEISAAHKNYPHSNYLSIIKRH